MSSARWTHATCTGCGTTVCRDLVTEHVPIGAGMVELERRVLCASPGCLYYGTELERRRGDVCPVCGVHEARGHLLGCTIAFVESEALRIAETYLFSARQDESHLVRGAE